MNSCYVDSRKWAYFLKPLLIDGSRDVAQLPSDADILVVCIQHLHLCVNLRRTESSRGEFKLCWREIDSNNDIRDPSSCEGIVDTDDVPKHFNLGREGIPRSTGGVGGCSKGLKVLLRSVDLLFRHIRATASGKTMQLVIRL